VVSSPVGRSDDSQFGGLDSCLAALGRVVVMLTQTERRVQASEQAIKRSEQALDRTYVQLGRLRPNRFGPVPARQSPTWRR
jgi:hypothetical protein